MSEEPDILLGQMSADGHLEATVESDGKTVYLYLSSMPGSEFGMRAVWVRNLVAATPGDRANFDQAGSAPVNPRAFCQNPFPGRLPDRDALEFVWLPEGNGVALYEAGQLLALIPPWSGEGGFAGYSLAAKGQGPLAWPLPETEPLSARFAAARAYWAAWEEGKDTWAKIQKTQLATYERALGESSNYYAIDNGAWPPKAIVRTPHADAVVVTTLGVSVRPQPNVERTHDDYEAHNQVELGAVLPSTWSDERVVGFLRFLSGCAAGPWERFTFFGPGHTLPCDAWRASEFSAALFVKDHPAMPEIEHEPQFARPVTMLWLVPITAQERELAMREGSDVLLAELPEDRWRHA